MTTTKEKTPERKRSLRSQGIKKMGSGLMDKIFKRSKRKNKRSLIRDESHLLGRSNQHSVANCQPGDTWTYRDWEADMRNSSSLSYLLSDGYKAGSSDDLDDKLPHPRDIRQNVDTSILVKTDSTEPRLPFPSRLQRQRNFRRLSVDTRRESSDDRRQFCRQISSGCDQPLAMRRGLERPSSFLDESETDVSTLGSYLASEELSVSSELTGSSDEHYMTTEEPSMSVQTRDSDGEETHKSEPDPGDEPPHVPSPSKSTRVLLKNQYYKQKLGNSPAMMRDRLLSSSSEHNFAAYLEVSMRIH